jgi:hypothetical protein
MDFQPRHDNAANEAADAGQHPKVKLTALKAPGKTLAKQYHRDAAGRITKRPYDNAAEFLATVHEVDGIDGLAALLERVSRQRDTCVIRGEPNQWHPGPGQRTFRLLRAERSYASPDGRRVKADLSPDGAAEQRRLVEAGELYPTCWLPMFKAQASRVVMIDFDHVKAPGGLEWRNDLVFTADHLRSLLPAEFHDVCCWYQATGSAADPTKADLGGDEIRMRFAFVLSDGVTTRGLERLLEGSGADPATFRPVQITYVARPVFTGGLIDPMPVRSGVLAGLEDVVQVPAHVLAEPEAEERPFTDCDPAASADGLGLLPSPKLDRALERMAEDGGAAGTVRNGLIACVFGYIEDVGRDRVDVTALTAALEAAAGQFRSDAEVAAYGIGNIIAWCLQHTPAGAAEDFDEMLAGLGAAGGKSDDDMPAGGAGAKAQGAAADEGAGWKAKLNAKIAAMNERYFVTLLGGKVVIASRTRDEQLKRERLVYSSAADLRLLYGNVYVQTGVTKNGTQQDGSEKTAPVYAPLGRHWLSSAKRRTYDGGMALIPRGTVPEGVYNLWRGWGVEPKPGAWPVLADLLLNVICSGNQAHYEWLTGWMAHCVQRPEKQAEVAFVMRGKKGIGKGSFAKIMQAFFRSHHVHVSHGKHLTGHFNAHLADCLFLFLDEALWAGDKAGEGVLKTAITEDALQIEPKGVDTFMVPNRLKIAVSGNEKWVVPASEDERRFFVLDVSPHRKGDKAYWTAVNAAIEGDECGALLSHLLKLDISDFDHRNPPHTAALGSQKLKSADSVAKFWLDCLGEGVVLGAGGDEWPAQVQTELLHDAYVARAKRHGERYPVSAAEMAARLVELCEGCAFHNKRPAGKTSGSRKRVYVLDTLDAHRTAFLAAMNIDPEHHTWPAAESDAGEGSRGAEEGVQGGAAEKPSDPAGRSRGSRGAGHPHRENGESSQPAPEEENVSFPPTPLDPLDPLDKARKHAGLRRGDVRTPAGPPWTPDPFAGLEGTLHHTAGCVASDGYDPLDLTGIV